MKFKDLYVLWEEHKKLYIKESSICTYSTIVENHLMPIFSEMQEVSEDFLQEFVLNKLSSGSSKHSVRDMVTVLKNILKFGEKKKLFPYTGFDINYPTTGSIKTKIEVINHDNGKKLFEYLVNNIHEYKNIGILIVLTTGIRIGEVCALKWGDLNCEDELIKINRTINRIYAKDETGKRKTKLVIDTPKTASSNREVPLSDVLVKSIKHIKKSFGYDEKKYILSNSYKPYEPRPFRSYYNEILKKLSIPHTKFHALRHGFATRCIESGVDVKTLSSILGHSKVSLTLDLYVHPNQEQKKKAVKQMLKLYK